MIETIDKCTNLSLGTDVPDENTIIMESKELEVFSTRSEADLLDPPAIGRCCPVTYTKGCNLKQHQGTQYDTISLCNYQEK